MFFGARGDEAAAFSRPEDARSAAADAGVAGGIELIAGALLVVGLFTRIAAFIASGEMAVAYFTFHVFNAFHGMPPGTPVSFDPQANHGVEAALYAVIFLYIAAAGGGVWSLDAAFARKAVP